MSNDIADAAQTQAFVGAGYTPSGCFETFGVLSDTTQLVAGGDENLRSRAIFPS